MVGVPSRHKSLALLAGVLLAQVLMLAVQVKRDSRGRLIRVWSMTAVTPFEKGGAWGFDKVRGVWDHYFALQGTTRQNEELRNENDSLKLTISQLQSKAAEGDRLAAGCTRICLKGLPCFTSSTVPMGTSRGKILSMPLVTIFSPGFTVSSAAT